MKRAALMSSDAVLAAAAVNRRGFSRAHVDAVIDSALRDLDRMYPLPAPPLPVTCQTDQPWVNPWTTERLCDTGGTPRKSRARGRHHITRQNPKPLLVEDIRRSM